MIFEKSYFRSFFGFKGWLLIIFSLIGVACSINAPTHSKKFIFKPGQQSLEVNIKKHCTYEIGVIFLSQGNDQTVRDFFGHARQIHLPALINMYLFDDSGKNLFSTVDFGGSVSGYRYGPNPLKLIAGKVYLEPGKYTAVIDIKNIEEDFSGFESSFFVSGVPKVTCGKKL